MNKEQREILNEIKIDCQYMDSPLIIEIMSEAIGWVSRRDHDVIRKREEDTRSGLEKAWGTKADS